MEASFILNMPEERIAGLIELGILTLGVLIALLLLVGPLVLRFAWGGPVRGGRAEPTVVAEEPPEAGRPGMVKVAVWVPETNAQHVQMLAKELRKTDKAPEPPKPVLPEFVLKKGRNGGRQASERTDG